MIYCVARYDLIADWSLILVVLLVELRLLFTDLLYLPCFVVPCFLSEHSSYIRIYLIFVPNYCPC